MSAHLPIFAELVNMRLLADLEYERDPPLTEQQRWNEELGRRSSRRKQVCSSAGALELSGTKNLPALSSAAP